MKISIVSLYLCAFLISFTAVSSYANNKKAIAPDCNIIGPIGDFKNLNCWGGTGVKVLSLKPGVLKLRIRGNSKFPHAFLINSRKLAELSPKRNYSLSALCKTDNLADGFLILYVYDRKGKQIKEYRSNRIRGGKKWGKVSVTFYSSAKMSYCRLILCAKGKTGAVSFKELKMSFDTPKLEIFKWLEDGKLKLNGKFNPAIFGADKKAIPELSFRLYDTFNNKLLLEKKLLLDRNYKLDSEIDLSKFNETIFRGVIEIKTGSKIFQDKFNYIPGMDNRHPQMKNMLKVYNDEVGVDVPEATSFTPQADKDIVVFTRGEPRWIKPSSIPLANEEISDFKLIAAPGDNVFLPFAVFPAKDLKNVTASFEGSPCDEPKIFSVKYWPQRTLYSYKGRTQTYWNIPELLEKSGPIALRKGLVQQYAIEVPISKDAKGKSTFDLVLRSGAREIGRLKVNIDVLPVKLDWDVDEVFGLYVDPIRWWANKEYYTDENIIAELKEIKSYGFNSLYLTAAPPFIHYVMNNGEFRIKWGEFVRQLKLSRKAGFLEKDYIVDPYVMERCIAKAAGLPKPKGRKYSKEFEPLIDQFFRELREIIKSNGFTEPVIAGVDEATHGDRLDESIRVLSIARKHGFKTAATTYSYVISKHKEFGNLLDYPIFGGVGFWDLLNKMNVKTNRELCKKYQSTFWWYGPGCYANWTPSGGRKRKTRQDGCLTENRYLNGFFFYRLGAKGCWTWTFSRVRESSENDFDGKRGEPKDQCIAYPAADGNGLIRTLQYEALRQGFQDFVAIKTLERILKESKEPNAKNIKAELDKRIEEIPWKNYTQYPDAKLGLLRQWVLRQILKIQRKTNE